jgi:hypothetical protein
MDAKTIGGRGWSVAMDDAGRALVRSTAAACLTVLAVGGLLLAIRRAGGALSGQLTIEMLAAWTGVLLLAAWGFRRAFAPTPLRGSGRAAYLLWAAPSVVLLLWAIGLSGNASPGALLALWGALLLEEGWNWSRVGSALSPWRRGSNRSASTLLPQPRVPARLLHSRAAGTADVEVDAVDPDVSQHLERRRGEDGRETLDGWVRAEVAAGGRHATAHVAICPPFAHVPECYAEQMDGPSAQVKTAQVLCHGVRFEIKLDEPAVERAAVLIEFSIQERG